MSKTIRSRVQQAKRRKDLTLGLTAAIAILVATPAVAQINKVNTTMSNVQGVLIGVAVTIFTIALLWVAFKMAFQHAKWSEVSNVVIGGIIAGGAPGIAAWLIN